MTETGLAVIPLTEIPVSEREQAKAEIVESYLFSSLVHTAETLTATITTTMQTGEEKVYALALLQILQRFHLETVKISALIIHGVLAEDAFDEKIFVPWDNEGLGRTVTLASQGNDVTLTISGTLLEDGKSGEIIHTFFDTGSDAGRILSDGSIDFRELHRYPSVKAGEPLLQVTLPDSEKNGLSHGGAPIQAVPAKEYPLQLGKNVEKVYITTEDGRPGYDVKASKEGVVTTRVEQNNIVFIDVNDRIVMGDIDYSVGNIGSDEPCPVNLQAETVCEGFTVNVAGSATIRSITGGDVVSGKKADVDQMLPGSVLTANGDISCRSVSASTITSHDGTIAIQREAMESLITANRVEMNASTSLLLNTHINACIVDLDKVRASGTNRVVLGAGLFSKREEMIKEKKQVAADLLKAEETLSKTKATLVGELKSLSAAFGEDSSVCSVFKAIVQSLKAYDFDKVPHLMSSLKRGNNGLAVNNALRTVEQIKQELNQFWEHEARDKELVAEIESVEGRLSTISFSINARIRPSAVIELHLGDRDKDPLILAAPPEKDQDHAVSVKGSFTLKSGLTFSNKRG